jgi:hypothetical protein
MARLNEGFSLGKSDVESVKDDADFKVGFELEFIARPHGDKTRHRYKKIDELNKNEFLEYMQPRRASYGDVFSNNFVPEYSEIFAADPNFERLFPDYIDLYKKSHKAWEQFYDTEEDLKRGIRPRFDTPAGRLTIAIQLIRAKGSDYMFRVWPISKIVELTDAHPNYGYADPEHTEIWTQRVDVNYEGIIKDLQQTFGIRAQSEGDTSRNWVVKRDGSLQPEQQNELGVEIVSPPIPLPQSLEIMQKMFKWLEDRGYYTNASCGFHIGVSYKGPEEMAKIDKLKLAALLGEDYLLKTFNREANRYTYPLITQLISNLKNHQISIQKLLADKNMKALIAEVGARLDTSKYHTAHLNKLQHGYVEFRIAGGQGYHTDFEKIRLTTLRYAYIMKAALDPNAFREEYYKKLSKILIAAMPDTSGLGAEVTDNVDPVILGYYKRIASQVSDLTDFRPHFKTALERFVLAQSTTSQRDKADLIRHATIALVQSAVSLAREGRRNNGAELKSKHVLNTPAAISLYYRIMRTYGVTKDDLKIAIGNISEIYQRFMNIFFGLTKKAKTTQTTQVTE